MRNPFGFAQNMGIYPDFCGIFNGVIIFMTMEWNGFPIFQLIQYPESIYGETTARQDNIANSFVPTSFGWRRDTWLANPREKWRSMAGKQHPPNGESFHCNVWSHRRVTSGKQTKSYWKWPFIVDLPIKNGDFSIVMLVYQRISVFMNKR